jgi:hypothetical protein
MGSRKREVMLAGGVAFEMMQRQGGKVVEEAWACVVASTLSILAVQQRDT